MCVPGWYLDLVTPAGEVSEGLDGHAYVCFESQRVHSSGVDGLDGGQLLLVFLHQVCKPAGRSGQSEGVCKMTVCSACDRMLMLWLYATFIDWLK